MERARTEMTSPFVASSLSDYLSIVCHCVLSSLLPVSATGEAPRPLDDVEAFASGLSLL